MGIAIFRRIGIPAMAVFSLNGTVATMNIQFGPLLPTYDAGVIYRLLLVCECPGRLVGPALLNAPAAGWGWNDMLSVSHLTPP